MRNVFKNMNGTIINVNKPAVQFQVCLNIAGIRKFIFHSNHRVVSVLKGKMKSNFFESYLGFKRDSTYLLFEEMERRKRIKPFNYELIKSLNFPSPTQI